MESIRNNSRKVYNTFKREIQMLSVKETHKIEIELV